MCGHPARARGPPGRRGWLLSEAASARPRISRRISTVSELRLFGRSAAPGVAEGVVAVLDSTRRSKREAGAQAEEVLALRQAGLQARAEKEFLAEKSTGDAADMLGFQVVMLSDDELVRPAQEAIEAGQSAAAAWEAAMDAEIAGYRESGDDHFSARTA